MDNYTVQKLQNELSNANFTVAFIPNKDLNLTKAVSQFDKYIELIGDVTKKTPEQVKDTIRTEALLGVQERFTSVSDYLGQNTYKIAPLDITQIETKERFLIFFPDDFIGDSYYSDDYGNLKNIGRYFKEQESTNEKRPIFKADDYKPIVVINFSDLKGEEDFSVDNEFKNFENFNDVDVPNYKEKYGDDFNVTVVNETFDIKNYGNVELKNAKKLLATSEIEFEKLNKSAKLEDIDSAMWTFDEVDSTYNIGISDGDKTSFVIWWQNKAGKELKGDFWDKYGVSFPTPREEVIKYLSNGYLFFDGSAEIGDRLQPRAIFLSGNIWRKKLYLDQEKNKTDFINRFGEEIYNSHKQLIDNYFEQNIWGKRLKVTGDSSQRLILTPVSPLAYEIYVSEIIDPQTKEVNNKFKVATSIKNNEIIEDVLNLKDLQSDNKFITKSSLTLQQAFLSWLKKAGEGKSALQYGIQWGKTTINVVQLQQRYIKPTNNPYGKTPADQDKWLREKEDAKLTGERLFKEFLTVGINQKDQTKVEVLFNQKFNSIIEVELKKVPIGFTYKKYLDNINPFTLREFNLRSIRYYLSRGSVGLAYGVGIGKTFCSIFCLKQALDLGLAQKVLISVPNQVYFQFAQEIQRGLGKEYEAGKKLNMFYNGRTNYIQQANNPVNGINLCTYSALSLMSFQKDTLFKDFEKGEYNNWVLNTSNFIFQGGDNTNVPEFKEFVSSKLADQFSFDSDNSTDEEFARGGATEKPIFIEEYDFLVIDEVHNFNALFTKVDGEVSEKQTGKGDPSREKSRYSSIRETQNKFSDRALKLFWLSQYIQQKNKNWNNTILLSATPFTNSPLQIFSMFAFLNRQLLKEVTLDSILAFFDTYSNIAYAEEVTTSLQIRKVNKFVGWINIIALQKLLYFMFDKSNKEEEDKAVERPQKIVLPLKRKMVNGETIKMKKENFVSTTLKQSMLQEDLWSKIKNYAQDPLITYEQICNEDTRNTTKYSNYPKPKKNDDEVAVEDANELSDGSQEGEKAKRNQKALQSLQWGRELTLSPYFYRCSGLKKDPTYEEFVETSPKILYAVKCIESVKNYHDSEIEGGSPISGQIIYYDYKVDSMTLIRDYLVEKIGFNINEIGIITGKGCYIGKKSYGNRKQVVADYFMGRVLNSETGEYTQLEDSKRVKVLLGSRAIREGINLQNYASVLYNLFLDYNPTDQVQLEGRIWRQGNAFANVRIVIPLMSNSIDVFMFQKLEDKTVRINQIWTKDGQKNEIDTDSFDPKELKYELLTDPVAIAQLEIEEKIAKIDDEIGVLCSELANLQDGARIFKKSNQILFEQYQTNFTGYNRFQLYQTIFLLRPDLVWEKPFLNKENIEKVLKKIEATGDNSFNYDYGLYNLKNYEYSYAFSNAHPQLDIAGSQETKTIARENLESLFNFTYEELIELTLLVIKEKKVGYPIGYTKNWRESREIINYPFLGDTVKYETKKGTKTGKITAMYNSTDVDLSTFSKDLLESIKDNQFSAMLDIEFKFKPVSFVIDDVIEKDLKDVELVLKKSKKKLIYPEPISYSNKDAKNLLNDMAEYLDADNLQSSWNSDSTKNKEQFTNTYSYSPKDMNEIINDGDIAFLQKIYLYRYNPIDILQKSDDSLDPKYIKYPELWVDFTEGGYFETFFKNSKVIAESKQTIPKLFERLDISSEIELNDLITQNEVDINTKELEKNSFDDEQLFEEIVQEVIRTQQELLGQFEREGNLYTQRVKEFATKNDEYGGNNYLSEFKEKAQEVRKEIESKKEIKESDGNSHLEDILRDIEELKEIMELSPERTKKLMAKDIKELEELYDTLNY